MFFSIITATYNSENTILNCINSVKSQNINNNFLFEHIIVDGKSTDNTVNILKEYRKNSNVKLISEKDNGIYDALNKGIKLSNGHYIVFLHSDDKFYDTNTFLKIYDFLKNNNKTGIYSNLNFIESNNSISRVWKSTKFKDYKLKFGWMPPHPTLILKRDVYSELGYFDTSLKISSDYDFILKLFLNFKNIIHYNKTTYSMRNDGISSSKNLGLKIKEDYIVLKRYYNSPSAITISILKRLSKIKQFKIW